MGIYDRPYYRDEPSSTFALGGQRSMVVNLILVNVAIFFIDAFTSDAGHGLNWLSYHMAATPEVLTQPWNWWKLLTYGFAHAPLDSPRSIFHVGFNMYALWLFGSDIESVRGRREFLLVYLSLIVLSGLTWVVLGASSGQMAPIVGASGAVTGIMILFVCHYPHRKFLLLFLPVPIPAWVLVGLFTLQDIWGAIGLGDSGVAYSCHLAGAASAFLYYRSGVRLERLTARLKSPPLLRRRPKLRVHDPDARYKDLDRQADRILEKLHREGAESLTAKERRILEDYSRRMRQKHG
jgi:membrane associated rhomboid family serine protease